MFMSNHLIGFGANSGASLVESLYDRTTGTNIGDMTGNGGLAAAWDGTTSQGFTTSARAAAASGYVGKQLSAASIISRVIVYPPTDLPSGGPGYSNAGSGDGTLSLYGKNSAPGSGTDGTLLATAAIANPQSHAGPDTLTSTDNVNTWAYVWVYFNRTSNDNTYIAEVQLYIYS